MTKIRIKYSLTDGDHVFAIDLEELASYTRGSLSDEAHVTDAIMKATLEDIRRNIDVEDLVDNLSGTVRDVQLALNAIMEKNGKPHAESMDLRSHVKAAVATGLPAGRYHATTRNEKPHIERVGSVRGRK